MGRLSERQLIAIFLILLAGLIVNGAVSYRAILQLVENERWVAHTHQVLAEVEGVMLSLESAESSQRGFVITGEDRYLGPYDQALAEVDQRIAKLRASTADNPRQQTRILELESHVRGRMEELRRVLDLRRSEGLEAARQRILNGRGYQEMKAVRAVVARMEEEENKLLVRRRNDSRASGRKALLTSSIANLVLLGLIGLTAGLVVRDSRERRRSEAQLRAAHGELEARVQERTADLAVANERLRLFTRELERSNRELQDFAFVASHDLQEPLRKIQAFGDRLKSKHGDRLGAEGIDYLTRMQSAAQRMHALINDLLTFSRVASKAQPFVPVDLGKIAGEVLQDLEVRVQQTGGRIQAGELPTIDADPLQMRQLLQNLMGNALKFHRPGEPPVVKVSGAVDGAAPALARIAVEDNGIGFDMKYLDRIFTPFQRLHGRSEYEGTGMGLAVCRRIVERHGGTLTAESVPGQGARFLAVLPVRQEREGMG